MRRAVRASEAITGEQLVEMLRVEAGRRGVPLNTLARALSNYPWSWLKSLEAARVPSPSTIARIRALISGEPVPPAPKGGAGYLSRGGAVHIVRSEDAPVPAERPLPRVTCFNCGATSMAPCVHLRRSGWVE
jgi:hypothetical protein